MPDKFIAKADLPRFLRMVKVGPLFGTVELDGQLHYARLEGELIDKISVEQPRPAVSCKPFFFAPRERVAVYPSESYRWEPDLDPSAPQIIVGPRACELYALEMLDKIFIEDDIQEPFYAARRAASIIVSVDCAKPAESCWCNLLDHEPFPIESQGYDINLSPVYGGYVVTAATERGEKLIQTGGEILRAPTQSELQERSDMRNATKEALKTQNAQFTLSEKITQLLRRKETSDAWLRLCSSCVECGACNNVCPTCHCFYLYDQQSGEGKGVSERVKVWDACMFMNYYRMAGVGGMKPTPSPELKTRFQRRFYKKFEWVPDKYELLGCVACGRCFDACPGDIDIRDVLHTMDSVTLAAQE